MVIKMDSIFKIGDLVVIENGIDEYEPYYVTGNGIDARARHTVHIYDNYYCSEWFILYTDFFRQEE